MIRNFLNRIFTSKVFYIIFSVLVAVSLWLFIEIGDNLEVSDSFEVPVYIIGEEVLRDRDLFISSINPEHIMLYVDAPRSEVAALRRGPLMVEIDVSRITTTGITSVEHEIVYPDDVDPDQIRTSANITRISLNIDRLTSIQVPVQAPYTGGTSSEELVVDPSIIDPPIITVGGPEDVLSRIGVAHVSILRENLSSTTIDDYPFTLLDEYGEELDEELLEQLIFSDETVRVTVPIRMIREVPLRVDFFHGAGTTDENIDYSIEPMSVVLTGDPVAFQDLSAITLGTIDLNRFGLTTPTPEVFNIIVPSNLENVSGITQANVSFDLIGLEWDSYSVANINAVNIPTGYEAVILNERMVVRVRGAREDLDYLAELMDAGGLNIRIEVDLDGLGQGTHRLQPPTVRIFIDGVDRDIGAVGVPTEYLVTVRITPIPDELE